MEMRSSLFNYSPPYWLDFTLIPFQIQNPKSKIQNDIFGEIVGNLITGGMLRGTKLSSLPPPAGKVCREYLVMYHLSPNLDTIYKLNTTLT